MRRRNLWNPINSYRNLKNLRDLKGDPDSGMLQEPAPENINTAICGARKA